MPARRRSRCIALALVATLGVRSASAEDAPATPDPEPAAEPSAPPKPPPTPEAAADEFLAVAAGTDDDAIRTVVIRVDPDGWLVAQCLLARGKRDAALDFARRRSDGNWFWEESFAIDPAGEASVARQRPLADYVASATTFDRRAWDAIVAAEGLASVGNHADALGTLGAARPTDPVLATRHDHGRARALLALGRRAEAISAYRAAADGAERTAWFRRARTIADERVPLLGDVDPKAYADALLRGGRLLAQSRDRAGADAWVAKGVEWLGRAAAIEERLGDPARAAEALESQFHANRRGDAFEWRQLLFLPGLERALELRRAAADLRGEARVLGLVAESFDDVGDERRALAVRARQITLLDRIGDRAAILLAVADAFRIADHVADRTMQTRLLDRAAALVETGPLGARIDASRVLSRMHETLQDFAAAIATERRRIALLKERAPDVVLVEAWTRIGVLCAQAADHVGALEAFRTARASVPAGEVSAELWAKTAWAHEALGQWRDAIAIREARIGDAVGDASKSYDSAEHTVALALDYDRVGRTDDALAILGTLSSGAYEGRGVNAARAHILFRRGDLANALADARVALDEARLQGGAVAVEGHGSSHWFGIDSRHAIAPVETGILASLGLSSPADALHFLECGRASSLASFLAAKEQIQRASVPQALAGLEATARTAEALAVAALRGAETRAGASVDETRRLRREVGASRETLQRVVDAIQRARSAGVERADVVSLDDTQRTLARGEVLVAYALLSSDAVALVVRPTDARIVRLADATEVETACAALAGPRHDASLEREAERLRALLVEPLGLDVGDSRVLVSTDGELTFVPFTLVFPDREVVHVPSATTSVLLRRAAATRGEGVLALGDPDYGAHATSEAVRAWRPRAGGVLTRLPATADEAKRVGDVVLLAKDASEARLRDALATRPRWRALHLACHGLQDAAQPMFSSLALTPAGGDDGFLSLVDVLGMDVRADLVVLSACETGRGTQLEGEGVLGLTRAFLRAGAPRVIVSLWKVDDEATRELMTKFYALWNPKDGTKALAPAAALKAAQAHVRSQEKWKHPYYWAAWQLWGLPE